jgi:uncharacterized protein YecT (DUF1311 family)
MHYRALLLALFLPSAASHAQQTQYDLNRHADRRARVADSTLEVLYRQLEARYRTDSVALRKLRVAQRAWVAFRKAQIEATYPAEGNVYGSVQPMCVSDRWEQLTRARIAQLREALHPLHGDVCEAGPPYGGTH